MRMARRGRAWLGDEGQFRRTFGQWLAANLRGRDRGNAIAGHLARAVGVSHDRVTDWILDRAVPSPGEAAAVAAYLGVPAAAVRAEIDRAQEEGR